MFVNVEIKAGMGRDPTKSDIQKNIDALNHVMKHDDINSICTTLLIDTRSILEGIQRGLPNE